MRSLPLHIRLDDLSDPRIAQFLEEHLQANKESRVFLDVLPSEPPGNHALIEAWRKNEEWLAGRLVINPHNAYFSDRSHVDQMTDALETVRLALFEGSFRNTIN